MVFEVYVPKRRKSKADPQPLVKLSKSSIVLDKVSRATLKCDLLELAYNAQSKSIRIRPGTEQTGLPLLKTKLNARGFFKEFNITDTGKYIAKYDENENALYVQL